MVPPLLSLNLNTPNTALQIAHILLEYGADVNAAMPASTTLPETTGDTALLNLCRQLAFIDVSQLPQISSSARERTSTIKTPPERLPSWRAAEECCWETIPWTG